jgi:argininosuccinate lyase
MATKLWQKAYSTNEKIEHFTVGRDAEFDIELALFDVQGSLAHTIMLESIGLLESNELELVQKELKNIYQEILKGDFVIAEGVEDVHSQVEILLTERIGEVGKKIHSGRSRNDQVLVDLKLYIRSKLTEVTEAVAHLVDKFTEYSEKYKDQPLPGYTHLQVAMPSSFGLWFGAYAESLVDDLHLLQAAYEVANKNPLGSAAGYGSSFPLNRTMTTELLGFENLNYNVVYAQMSRGKTERIAATALASVAATLGRMAMDTCLYNNQNFGFITFPKEYTTGSSIMPHKKNPDVFEIMRGKCNQLQALPVEITMIMSNLPSGYHREMQLIKENFFPAFDKILECISMAEFMFDAVQFKEGYMKNPIYDHLYSVDVVNDLALKGTPFRDAYKIVGDMVDSGNFVVPEEIKHVHEGSKDNLCNAEVLKMKTAILNGFAFDKVERKITELVN